jgi:hypothetical protein
MVDVSVCGTAQSKRLDAGFMRANLVHQRVTEHRARWLLTFPDHVLHNKDAMVGTSSD